MQHNDLTTDRYSVGRRVSLIALVAATCFGVLTVSSSSAQAAPIAASSPVIHDDPLAPIAAAAVLDLQILQASGGRDARDVVEVSARYAAARDAIATEVADRVGVDPDRMKQAWATVDYQHQTALMAAFSQLGVRYRRNSSIPGEGFDCSGLTTYAWGIAGVTLTRQSRSQMNNASARTIDTARAGDLAYYPGHVMLYLGVDKAIVHSPTTGRTVEVRQLSNRKNIRFADPSD
jgi:cell wall-associated NlpC family hydrolase